MLRNRHPRSMKASKWKPIHFDSFIARANRFDVLGHKSILKQNKRKWRSIIETHKQTIDDTYQWIPILTLCGKKTWENHIFSIKWTLVQFTFVVVQLHANFMFDSEIIKFYWCKALESVVKWPLLRANSILKQTHGKNFFIVSLMSIFLLIYHPSSHTLHTDWISKHCTRSSKNYTKWWQNIRANKIDRNLERGRDFDLVSVD